LLFANLGRADQVPAEGEKLGGSGKQGEIVMRKKIGWVVLVLSITLTAVHTHARSLSGVFQRVNPAVVVILTSTREYARSIPGQSVYTKGLGSGVVVSADGLIMTAAHVVQVADAVAVQFLDGSRVTARVVSSSILADVALLELDSVPDGLVVADLGDSGRVAIGDEIFVVGAPYGIDHTLTVGYISGRRTPDGVCNEFSPIEFLQTDAAINRGNSGGPMFSIDGKLVGIVSRILSQSGGSEGVGFAVTINTARELLLRQKSFWSGLEFYYLSGALAEAFNLPQDAGLLVQRVAESSPGQALGLKPGTIPVRIGSKEFLIGGDVVLEVQGIPISTDWQTGCRIREKIVQLGQGQGIKVKVLRAGEIRNLSAYTLGK
jgi:S1-C subfamily serine protease